MSYWTVFWLNAGIVMNSIGIMMLAWRLVKGNDALHLRISMQERFTCDEICEMRLRLAQIEAGLPDNWRKE